MADLAVRGEKIEVKIFSFAGKPSALTHMQAASTARKPGNAQDREGPRDQNGPRGGGGRVGEWNGWVGV